MERDNARLVIVGGTSIPSLEAERSSSSVGLLNNRFLRNQNMGIYLALHFHACPKTRQMALNSLALPIVAVFPFPFFQRLFHVGFDRTQVIDQLLVLVVSITLRHFRKAVQPIRSPSPSYRIRGGWRGHILGSRGTLSSTLWIVLQRDDCGARES